MIKYLRDHVWSTLDFLIGALNLALFLFDGHGTWSLVAAVFIVAMGVYVFHLEQDMVRVNAEIAEHERRWREDLARLYPGQVGHVTTSRDYGDDPDAL